MADAKSLTLGLRNVRAHRNWMNWTAGWVLAAGLLLFTAFVVDLLNVGQRADNDMGWGTFGLTATAVTMAAALIGYRLFTRPSVAVAPGALRITNPTRQWRVPVDLITGTDDNLTYVRVHAGDRRIVCAGLEKSNLSLLRGDTTIDERIDRAMVKAQSDDHGDEKVTWRWTRPDVPEVVLLCSWGVYFAIGAFVSHR
jgi:hypothetical protein